MARPTKPVVVLQTEKKTHKTKRELASRAREEKSLLTGKPLRASEEVKENPEALREFRQVKKTLATIGKDDSLYSAQISRYCLLIVETRALSARKAKLEAAADGCEDPKDAIEFYRLANTRGDNRRAMIKWVLAATSRVYSQRYNCFLGRHP